MKSRYSWKRRMFIALLLLVAAGQAWAQATKPARDFTFFLLSDIHIGAENLKAHPPVTADQNLAKLKAHLAAMGKLVGQAYPDQPALRGLQPNSVAAPSGFMILGDLTDGSKERAKNQEQWQQFNALFPATDFTFASRSIPVFAIAGNHDGPVADPQRQGLLVRNRALQQAGLLSALSSNGVHYAIHHEGVHFIFLNLCPADAPDAQTPFKFGAPGIGSWNDPQGALAFLKEYLARQVGKSGAPVVLLHHYGFDSFSLNDWNWWTLQQRRALYELLEPYNVVALLHGHNHHAEHYRWPDPKRHAADLAGFFEGKPPANPRQYDVLSCGSIGWVLRVRDNQFTAAHFSSRGWSADPALYFSKPLTP